MAGGVPAMFESFGEGAVAGGVGGGEVSESGECEEFVAGEVGARGGGEVACDSSG